MSKVVSLAASLGMSVTAVEVAEINAIVFKTAVDKKQFGQITTDGSDTYIIDVKNNTAEKLTPATVKDLAVAGYKAEIMSMAQASAVAASESTGTVLAVTMVKDGTGTIRPASIASFCKAAKFEVTDVEVETQNDIIFKTNGIKSIDGLVKDGADYYQIDVVNNTATVVNAAALSKQAVADFMSGKNTSATAFAETFGLIKTISFKKV